MNVDASFEANPQLAEGSEPGVGSLDAPSVTAEPVVALDASAGNAGFDASALEVGSAARAVVALCPHASCQANGAVCLEGLARSAMRRSTLQKLPSHVDWRR